MKKLLTTLLFAAITISSVFSQAPDFTMIAVDGKEYNLYEELGNNKPVLLAFFATACGSCQYAVPTLETFWNELFEKGDEGWLWGIETSKVGDDLVIEFLNEYGGSYLGFSTRYNDSILTHEFGYGIDYTPQYCMICQDTMFKKIPLDQVEEAYYACLDTIPEDTTSAIYTVSSTFNDNYFYANNQIVIKSNKIQSGNYTIDIINTDGRTLINKKVQVTTSEGKSVINMNLSNGFYIVHLRNNSNTVSTGKIIVSDSF